MRRYYGTRCLLTSRSHFSKGASRRRRCRFRLGIVRSNLFYSIWLLHPCYSHSLCFAGTLDATGRLLFIASASIQLPPSFDRYGARGTLLGISDTFPNAPLECKRFLGCWNEGMCRRYEYLDWLRRNFSPRFLAFGRAFPTYEQLPCCFPLTNLSNLVGRFEHSANISFLAARRKFREILPEHAASRLRCDETLRLQHPRRVVLDGSSVGTLAPFPCVSFSLLPCSRSIVVPFAASSGIPSRNRVPGQASSRLAPSLGFPRADPFA